MSVLDRRPRPLRGQTLVQGRPVPHFPALPPEAERGHPRRITEVGEEVLTRTCRQVTEEELGSAELATLIDDMFLMLYVADGAGLAANQVGLDLALFVYDCLDDEGVRHVGHIVNPVLEPLEPKERRLLEESEGCLSVPGAGAALPRADRAMVHGIDQLGEPLTIEGTGYFARCLQHEVDHLHGHLYLDRLATRARREALRQMTELRDKVERQRAENAAALGHGEA